MTAVWKTPATVDTEKTPPALEPMTGAALDEVLALEAGVYSFPWSRGNFLDSLAASYIARVLRSRGGDLLGYVVAMLGADEMHLLNITVAPPVQRRGHARAMMEHLLDEGRRAGALRLWLEVRESNAGARAAYRRLGFQEAGIRPGYYPAARGRRESAVVMSLAIAALGSGSQRREPDALG